MKKFCDEVIDNSKIEQLTYTLLELIQQDNDVEEILYGEILFPNVHFKEVMLIPNAYVRKCFFSE